MSPRKKVKKPAGPRPVNPVKSEPEPVKTEAESVQEVMSEPELIKPVEPESEPVEPKPEQGEKTEEEKEENKVDNDLNNEIKQDEEEEEEEEVEYEEEEVEYEEIEEEVEEEEEEEDEERENVKGEERENNEKRENDEDKKHAELLARPPQGSEIYIGNIPINATEEELRSLCEPLGEIFEVRVMKDKGFAFVCYKSDDTALKAIKALNHSEFKGKKVRCSPSQSKNRIFIGNVPRKWGESDLKNAVNNVGPGVTRVDLMMDSGTGRSRGFAFVEYYNHACADYSLKKLSKPNFKLDSSSPTVSWADPRGSSDSSAKSQIKAVYVKNLPKDVREDKLKDLFEKHGDIEKVVLPPLKQGQDKKYAFIHFKNRADAMSALQDKYQVNGETVECSLAKPPSSEKKERFDSGPSANQRAPPVLSYYQSRSGVMGYGGPVPPAYMAPPLMAPPGMAMVPMLLPDGRLGYVLQQPPGMGQGHRAGNNNSNNYYNNNNNNNNNNSSSYRGEGGGSGSGRGKRGYEGGHRRGGEPAKRFRH